MEVIVTRGLILSIILFILDGIYPSQVIGILAVICIAPFGISILGALLLHLINFKSEIK